MPRLSRPAASAIIERILLDPLLINGSQFFIDGDALLIPKTAQQIRCMGNMNAASRPRTAAVIMNLRPAKNGTVSFGCRGRACPSFFNSTAPSAATFRLNSAKPSKGAPTLCVLNMFPPVCFLQITKPYEER